MDEMLKMILAIEDALQKATAQAADLRSFIESAMDSHDSIMAKIANMKEED